VTEIFGGFIQSAQQNNAVLLKRQLLFSYMNQFYPEIPQLYSTVSSQQKNMGQSIKHNKLRQTIKFSHSVSHILWDIRNCHF